MSKRSHKSDTGVTSDLKDIGILCIGFTILFLVWLIAICIQVMIEFWYISSPALCCLAYAYLKTRVPAERQPSTITRNTIEDIKINNGTRKTRTIETYEPDRSPDLKLLTRLI